MTRASRAALLLTLSLAASGCARNDSFTAALCTSAPGETPAASCEGPKRPVSLTLPRADLLQKVPLNPDDVTGSTAGREPAPAGLAQTTRDTEPALDAPPPREPAAAPVPAAATPAPDPAAPIQITAPAAPAASPPAPQPDAAARSVPEQPKDKETAADDLKPGEKSAERDARIEAASNPAGPSRQNRSERNQGDRILSGPPMTLAEAVRRAIGDHPLIGVAGARVTESAASVGIAEAGLYPQMEGRLGVGPGVTGTYQTSTNLGYFSNDNASGAFRAEGSLAGRQLLFDFGATRADIDRASSIHWSEQLKQREQTEDVVNKVTDVYLKLLEQREMLSAATENVAALVKIVKLVEDNEKNGNGTVADMKRVQSRLVDGQTGAADAKSELQTGSDRFRRLVRVPPGTLRHAPVLTSQIPRSPSGAIAAVPKSNPRIQALEATLKAARHEADAMKANGMPKVTFETDVGVKEYRTRVDKTELDAKGLVVFKYKFLDGGLQSRQVEQVHSRVLQTELRLRNDVDEVEAEIRRHYRVLESARGKSASLTENVQTAAKARQLYDEQFRGGKRTLLELLDIQTTYYTARRTLIQNRFEEQRSVNGVLLAMGRLTEAMLTGKIKQ